MRAAASASVVGMVDRFPMMHPFEAALVGAAYGLWDRLTRFFSGRMTSSNVGTCVLSNQNSNVAPANFTGCVAGVRYQELYFSAFVLSTVIASDDCRHPRNIRLRRASSSPIVRRNQRRPTRRTRMLNIARTANRWLVADIKTPPKG
jgi:hypothetical protein